MKKKNHPATVLLFLFSILHHGLFAEEVVRIYRTDGVCLLLPTALTDSMSMGTNGNSMRFHLPGNYGEIACEQIDSITIGESTADIVINYDGTRTTAVNPYAFRGLDISIGDNGAVTVINQIDSELTYHLQGSGIGSFKLYSPKKQIIEMNALELNSADGPAINIQSKKKTTIIARAGTVSKLIDTNSYTLAEDEDMKGTLFSEGQLVFGGEGTIRVEGNYKHAICSDDYISITNGIVFVDKTSDHGIHAKDYFVMSGGEVEVVVDKDESKGLKSNGNITITDGAMRFYCSGNATVTDGDPSYCTAIKSDSAVFIEGGNIYIEHSGKGGKGISADSIIVISGGDITIACTGDGSTYTNTENAEDTYNATCIKADKTLTIVGGTLTLSNSGTGGKCLACDEDMIFGNENGGPTLTASTKGSKIGSSSSSSFGPGGWGGGGRPGGHPSEDQNSSGGNPKAIRADGDITINNGQYAISTAADGGEGVEAKQTLTINGGTIVCNTYDDALQGAEAIVINDGYIYAYASNNDGVDANGTITINGGVVISSGTTEPEEGFDCDQNTFKITGGVIVGVGGATSTPTASVCTQPVGVYSGSGSQQTTYTICQTDGGEHILSFTLPRSYNSMVMLFSSPLMQQNTGYTIYTGGNVSGGQTFYGLTTGATFTNGTAKKTFTTQSMVTTIR